jgi:predicted transcriptional regulator
MKFSDAFHQTLFHFDIKAIDISKQSGLTTGQISQFRSGRNLRIDSVERILEVLPEDARRYMLTLVAQNEASQQENMGTNGTGKNDTL